MYHLVEKSNTNTMQSFFKSDEQNYFSLLCILNWFFELILFNLFVVLQNQ